MQVATVSKLHYVVVMIRVVALVLTLAFTAEAGRGFYDGCRWLMRSGIWAGMQLNPESDVEIVQDSSQLEGVTEVMAQAFQDDALVNWFHPNPLMQERLLRTFARLVFMNGAILQVAGGTKGTALWLEASKASAGPLSILLSGQAPLIPRFGLHTFSLLQFDAAAEKARRKLVPGEERKALYLWFIGTTPQARGKGWARALMQPVLEFADREKRPILLETQKYQNISLYEHFGFGDRETWQIPQSVPETTTMVRRPSPH